MHTQQRFGADLRKQQRQVGIERLDAREALHLHLRDALGIVAPIRACHAHQGRQDLRGGHAVDRQHLGAGDQRSLVRAVAADDHAPVQPAEVERQMAVVVEQRVLDRLGLIDEVGEAVAAAHAGGQAGDRQIGLGQGGALAEFGAQRCKALRNLLLAGIPIQPRMQRSVGLLQHRDVGKQGGAGQDAITAHRWRRGCRGGASRLPAQQCHDQQQAKATGHGDSLIGSTQPADRCCSRRLNGVLRQRNDGWRGPCTCRRIGQRIAAQQEIAARIPGTRMAPAFQPQVIDHCHGGQVAWKFVEVRQPVPPAVADREAEPQQQQRAGRQQEAAQPRQA